MFIGSLQRYEIVNGVVEVEGIANEAPVEKEEDKAAEGTSQNFNLLSIVNHLSLTWCLISSGNVEKGVPDFWLTAMKTNEVLAEEVKRFLKPFSMLFIDWIDCGKIIYCFLE